MKPIDLRMRPVLLLATTYLRKAWSPGSRSGAPRGATGPARRGGPVACLAPASDIEGSRQPVTPRESQMTMAADARSRDEFLALTRHGGGGHRPRPPQGDSPRPPHRPP